MSSRGLCSSISFTLYHLRIPSVRLLRLGEASSIDIIDSWRNQEGWKSLLVPAFLGEGQSLYLRPLKSVADLRSRGGHEGAEGLMSGF